MISIISSQSICSKCMMLRIVTMRSLMRERRTYGVRGLRREPLVSSTVEELMKKWGIGRRGV